MKTKFFEQWETQTNSISCSRTLNISIIKWHFKARMIWCLKKNATFKILFLTMLHTARAWAPILILKGYDDSGETLEGSKRQVFRRKEKSPMERGCLDWMVFWERPWNDSYLCLLWGYWETYKRNSTQTWPSFKKRKGSRKCFQVITVVSHRNVSQEVASW